MSQCIAAINCVLVKKNQPGSPQWPDLLANIHPVFIPHHNY
jgi:hypothetical protein